MEYFEDSAKASLRAKFEPDADTLVTRSEAEALTISAQLGERGRFAKVSICKDLDIPFVR